MAIKEDGVFKMIDSGSLRLDDPDFNEAVYVIVGVLYQFITTIF